MIFTRCRACKAEIFFASTPKGKSMPLNGVEVTTTDSKVVLYSEGGERVVGEEGKVRRGYVSHFATCPNAKDFRR